MFKNGDKVKTTQAYYELFGRTVWGTICKPTQFENFTLYDGVYLVRWDFQEGNVVSEHQGQMVLMTADSLEGVKM